MDCCCCYGSGSVEGQENGPKEGAVLYRLVRDEDILWSLEPPTEKKQELQPYQAVLKQEYVICKQQLISGLFVYRFKLILTKTKPLLVLPQKT